jgi:AbrB family looped-hinge helix DNA binding protein
VDKVLKSIIRLVRTQKNQQVINIPAEVKNTLGLKGGDAVGFVIFEGGQVLLVRVDPTEFIKHIGVGA